MNTETETTKSDSPATPAPKKTKPFAIWILLVRVVALYQIGVGMYWFADEIGFHGTIARLDLAVLMAVAIALGIGLWLRSFACMVLSALLYPATIAYMKFLGQMDWNPMVLVFFGLPVLLLAFGGLLRGKEEVKRTTDEQ